MASLIPGYEYDIFISYRQKDNRHDGWVTNFVRDLKGELESTFKEEISLYFDINPRDGLLETHDVDASLKEKLRSVILIPVISRTYCDPTGFAWKNEFCEFNRMAREDPTGRNIRLPNGNVASRILPVKIHDLDPEDRIMLEKELGGTLRGIDFIYSSPGVNRPLRADEDHPHDNLNKTYYRDQINKLANAIRDVLNAMRHATEHDKAETKTSDTGIRKQYARKSRKIIMFSALAVLLTAVCWLLAARYLQQAKPVEKSIAVLPFINDSPDQENAYFINGIMEEILNKLQKIKDFRVLSRTSTEQYRGSSRSIPGIGRELDVNYILEGSGQRYGNNFRLRVQLIAVRNEKHVWAESFEQEIRETKDIFRIQTLIAERIAEELNANISPEEQNLIVKIPTLDLPAYDLYRRGMEVLNDCPYPRYIPEIVKNAEDLFKQAIQHDQRFAEAYTGLAQVLWIRMDRSVPESETDIRNKLADSMLVLANAALSLDNKLSDAYIIKGAYYSSKGQTGEALAEWKEAVRYNPNDWWPYWMIGCSCEDSDMTAALENLEKSAAVNHDKDLTNILNRIGYNYYQTGFPDLGRSFLEEILKLDHDTTGFNDRVVLYETNTRGDYINAVTYYRRKVESGSCTPSDMMALGGALAFLGDYQESAKYFGKYLKAISQVDETRLAPWPFPNISDRLIGFVWLQTGEKIKADSLFRSQIKILNKELKLVSPDQKISRAYPLACICAVRGDKAGAYETLKIFGHSTGIRLGWLTSLQYDPMLNSLRNDQVFIQLYSDLETRYLNEHKRIETWLKERKSI